MDDEKLIRQWLQQATEGDREAATQLLRSFYKTIYAYLRRLSQNEADAADLTQETFGKIWQSLSQYRGQSKVSTWMHRIAYYSWVDWVRRQPPLVKMSSDWWLELNHDDPSPSSEAAQRDHQKQLWRLVDQLPEQQKQALHLRYGQQLTLKETSEVLDLPLSTLKLRIRSALEHLRTQFKDSNNHSSLTNLNY